MRILFLLMCILFCAGAFAQRDSLVGGIHIEMDEVTVVASRKGFDIGAFIRRVQTDTSFYKAFKRLHLRPYTAQHQIEFKNERGAVAASMRNTLHQYREGRCRYAVIRDRTITGNMLDRKGSYRYLTAKMFDLLFLQTARICGETDIAADPDPLEAGRLGKYRRQLQKLVFSPGSKVEGVPFMGNRASIFDPEIAPLYDFKVSSATYSGIPCYLFTARPKPSAAGKVVFNRLDTWFRKSDNSIVARDYDLSYRTMVYDFDVSMKVRLDVVDRQLVPVRIEYTGNWHAVTQPRERGHFISEFSY